MKNKKLVITLIFYSRNALLSRRAVDYIWNSFYHKEKYAVQ